MPAYTLLTDSGSKPIPQYENNAGTAPEAIKGEDGAPRVRQQDGHNVTMGTKADAVAGADLSEEWSLISLWKAVVNSLRTLTQWMGPDHEWSGTQLRFQKPDSTWGAYTDLQGDPGTAETDVITQLDNAVLNNVTIPAGKNAYSVGPLTIDDAVTVTVADGSRWAII